VWRSAQPCSVQWDSTEGRKGDLTFRVDLGESVRFGVDIGAGDVKKRFFLPVAGEYRRFWARGRGGSDESFSLTVRVRKNLAIVGFETAGGEKINW